MKSDRLMEAFPLTWPDHRPRTPPSRRREAQFKVSFFIALSELREAVGKMGGADIIVSTDIPLRRDGLPRSDDREPADPGVALYFERGGKQFVIACDAFSKARHNMRAVGLTIEALRSIERYGSTQLMEQAFQGFLALPPAMLAEPSWWDVLGVHPEAPMDTIRDAFRGLAAKHHPDHGGTHEQMASINRAFEAARQERGE